MALEVIGAGLGRTGTLSLKTALNRLGFGPCHHMTEVFADRDRHFPMWNAIADGATPDWDGLFAGYRSTCDWPAANFWAELAERYPEAKVILTLRDPARWYASMHETVLEAMRYRGFAERVHPEHPVRFVGTVVSDWTFGFDFSEANVIAAFERHNAEVRRRIAPDRLLLFEVSEGWEPLCRFLGVPVPDEPFPRVNERREFWDDVPEIPGPE